MIKQLKIILTTLLVPLVIMPAVQAQIVAPVKTIDDRLTEIEQEVQVLKRLKEVEQEINLKKEKETPVIKAGKDGFSINSKDGENTLQFKGYVQADSRFFVADNTQPGSNTFVARRVRPIFQGTVFKYADFLIMPDFGNGTVVLQDAYLDFKYWPQASIKFGKFKEPLSLERLRSDTNSAFTEQSFVTGVAPNRDTGIDIHGDFWEGGLSYDLGVFNGVVDGGSTGSADLDNADDKDLVGRVFVKPFKNSAKDWLSGLGVGLAASYGQAHGTAALTQLATYKTNGQLTDFSYRSNSTPTTANTVYADGNRVRFDPQLYYSFGPFGLLTEYVGSSQNVRLGTKSEHLTNRAWAIQGSYVVTGEDASFGAMNPRNAFDPRSGKWGAFEFVSRFQQIAFDGSSFDIFSNTGASVHDAQGFGVGLNWYLNQNLKFMLDYDRIFFNGGAIGINRESENLITTRVQVQY